MLLLKENPCLPLDLSLKGDIYNKRWRQGQRIANSFWKRWLKYYLPALQARQKWTVPHRNFAVGDLVLIVDEKSLHGHWSMGLIEEVFPNSNGKVRRVKVKTASSHLMRDIRKLCLLEGALTRPE